MATQQRPDWPVLIAQFKQSGLSQSAFCRQKGLKKSTFNSHLHSDLIDAQPSAFIRAERNDQPKLIEQAKSTEYIILEVGLCKIHWPNHLAITSLANLVKQLS